MPAYFGQVCRSYNFCDPGYGIAGINTFGWDNNVKRYEMHNLVEDYLNLFAKTLGEK